jgi:uncharacterized phage-associated protein
LTICKHIFFADKQHFLKYGRPITGDHYHKLPHGPCPTVGLDMLRGKGSPANVALLEKYVAVVGNAVHPKKTANLKAFSKSDVEVLDWVIKKYGKMSATRLRDLGHKERAYREAEDSGPMDFALFFDDDDENSVKKLAEREQEARDLLRRYAV